MPNLSDDELTRGSLLLANYRASARAFLASSTGPEMGRKKYEWLFAMEALAKWTERNAEAIGIPIPKDQP